MKSTYYTKKFLRFEHFFLQKQLNEVVKKTPSCFEKCYAVLKSDTFSYLFDA